MRHVARHVEKAAGRKMSLSCQDVKNDWKWNKIDETINKTLSCRQFKSPPAPSHLNRTDICVWHSGLSCVNVLNKKEEPFAQGKSWDGCPNPIWHLHVISQETVPFLFYLFWIKLFMDVNTSHYYSACMNTFTCWFLFTCAGWVKEKAFWITMTSGPEAWVIERDNVHKHSTCRETVSRMFWQEVPD